MNTKIIIDECLKTIGEDDPDNPSNMTRAECLRHINILYQNDIGKRINNMSIHIYDGSDAAHTITNGIGALPSDFLAPIRIYDGDANTNLPLTKITDINNKVADSDETSQYMIPDNSHIWIFGITPSNMIKMYYLAKPDALTDSTLSSPTALKEEFHCKIFTLRIGKIYAERNNNLNDMQFNIAAEKDELDLLAMAYNQEMNDADEDTFVIKVE